MKNEPTPLTPNALTTILADIKKNQSFEPIPKRGAPFTFSDLSFLMLVVAGMSKNMLMPPHAASQPQPDFCTPFMQ
jgi:hypothetical protein